MPDILPAVSTGLLALLTILVGLVLLRSGRQASAWLRLGEAVAALPAAIRAEAREGRDDLRAALAAQGQLFEMRLSGIENTVAARLGEAGRSQAEQLEAMRREAADRRARLEEVIGRLVDSNAEKHDTLRQTVSSGLDRLRGENGEKLEQMRATVDEKLQGTLERRLGESFALVSERLEQVHKGLGEMQSLATGVGDLKRVLSNVKARGGWGEVQLGMLLEDMLTREQYACNVRIRPEAAEVVEFAVRLPGGGDGSPLLLPIDAKFPHEDYERLLQAQEGGLPDDIERAGAALERAVRLQARTIGEKYVHPPHSTDFAILYLPTEGLFAEVIRRPGLASELQSRHRIMIQGPTTLAALLTSLQMGFRTLAIEKRSSEVWQVLGAAKAEFEKYGHVWDKLGKQLDTARRTVEEAGKRTRALSRKLRDVETVDLPEAAALLAFAPEIDNEEEAGAVEAA